MSMPHFVILDESGDLGWEFTKPYRKGGSSRFLTIGYIICPEYLEHHLQRIVRKTYKRYGFKESREKKGAELHKNQRDYIVNQAVRLLESFPEIKIGAITVKKENVNSGIKRDGNLLYNYMIKLSVLNKINGRPQATLYRDERIIKVASGNSCIDYLRTILLFELSSETQLIDMPIKSHTNLSIILADWIANMCWIATEDKIDSHLDRLSTMPNFYNDRLFF